MPRLRDARAFQDLPRCAKKDPRIQRQAPMSTYQRSRANLSAQVMRFCRGLRPPCYSWLYVVSAQLFGYSDPYISLATASGRPGSSRLGTHSTVVEARRDSFAAISFQLKLPLLHLPEEIRRIPRIVHCSKLEQREWNSFIPWASLKKEHRPLVAEANRQGYDRAKWSCDQQGAA